MSAVTQSTNDTEQYHLSNSEADDRPISEAVVEAVAAAEGVKPSELTARLYDSTDPDALNTVYKATTDRGEHLKLTFTLAGYEVVVESGRRILVRELDEIHSC